MSHWNKNPAENLVKYNYVMDLSTDFNLNDSQVEGHYNTRWNEALDESNAY